MGLVTGVAFVLVVVFAVLCVTHAARGLQSTPNIPEATPAPGRVDFLTSLFGSMLEPVGKREVPHYRGQQTRRSRDGDAEPAWASELGLTERSNCWPLAEEKMTDRGSAVNVAAEAA